MKAGKLLTGFGLLAIAMIIVAAGAVMLLRDYVQKPMAVTQPELITVVAGSSLQQVSNRLSAQGLLEMPVALVVWARYQGLAGSIKTGEYELFPGITPQGLLDLLVSGRNKQYPLTLVEGWTFQQALNAIWQSEKITVSLRDHSADDIVGLLGDDIPFLEGSIFPDTYFYTAGTTDLTILQRARQRLQNVLAEEWAQRLGSLPYDSPLDALIMASIIEKESGLHAEKQRIAGVFVRRLETGMRLQSDPTVIYGAGENYTGVIRRSDLNTETPFNTYRINGLPPTPIALSGRASIRASLHPEDGTYLYFVASGDGGHYFSSTLEEHNAAVQRYLRNPENRVNPATIESNN